MQLTLEPVTKRCSRCRQQLPVEQFGPDRKAKDGLTSSCRACRHGKRLTGPEQLVAVLVEEGMPPLAAAKVVRYWDESLQEAA